MSLSPADHSSVPNVVAVVVTYNRSALLVECLDAIYRQSCRPARTVVIENASTDDTASVLRQLEVKYQGWLQVVYMTKNTGGAGGFNEGLKQAFQIGGQWAWVMDDDVEPKEDALAALLEFLKVTGKKRVYLNSCARDGSGQHSVNMPDVDLRLKHLGYPAWDQELSHGAVGIGRGTFVSMLIPSEAVQEVGLPISQFFIWGDDTEFSWRMSKAGFQGYLVGHSQVLHKRPSTAGVDIVKEENAARVKLYTHWYRNHYYLNVNYPRPLGLTRYLAKTILVALRALTSPHGAIKVKAMFRGMMEGIRFKPEIERI